MLGQPRLLAMNAAYRLKFAWASGCRRINHSTSFWAAGSPIVLLMAAASRDSALRAKSIAFLTAARSPGGGAAAAAGGISIDGNGSLGAAATCTCLAFLNRKLR